MSNRRFKDLTAGMTGKEKLEYLWTYYKWVLLVAVFAAMVIAMVVTAVINNRTKYLYSGALVNVTPSEYAQTYLFEQWGEELGKNGKFETVNMTVISFGDLYSSTNEVEAINAMRIPAMVAAGDLDYVITDNIGYNFYINHPVFSPLDTIFSPEELEQIDLPLIFDQEGVHPIAFDITSTALAQDCFTRGEAIYLAFPGNSERTTHDFAFLTYLLGYAPQ